MAERYLALTCMKNEGPYILEWVAYHLSIGIDHFLVFTNDCEDGTVRILNRLAQMGHVTHVDNNRRPGQRPAHQVRAYRKAVRQNAYQQAEWVAVIDTDEFINIHVGDRSIRALTAAAPDSKCISLTWRLFGNAGKHKFRNELLTESFRRAAPYYCPSPMQAWGMKSIHRTDAIEVVGCHRPKIARDGDWDGLNWVNGSGARMPPIYYTNNWRMTRDCVGYELGQVNHYALRSRESYLVKAARGRAYTPDMVGADYWFKMDRNEELDETIQPLLPAAKEILAELMADETLARLHRRAMRWHRKSIADVAATPMGKALLQAISAPQADAGHP